MERLHEEAIVIGVVLCLCATRLLGQGPDTLWTRTYTRPDAASSGQQTSDSGYVIVGTSGYSPMWGAGWLVLVKIDSDGNVLWTRGYNERGYGISVRQTSDGGYVIVGIRGDLFDEPYRLYLIKTTPSGGVSWERSWRSGYYAEGSSVQETSDGGYIAVGSTVLVEGDSLLHVDVYLIKADSAGDSLWAKTYGGAGDDYGRSVQQTTDGGFIMVGSSDSFGSDSADIYLIKTDSGGNMVWARTYEGFGAKRGKAVLQTADGGYIVLGTRESLGGDDLDILLLRTDEVGDGVWAKIYGGTGDDIAISIEETDDGGYVMAGRTNSFGAGGFDLYLIRTDANGDTLWTQTHGGAKWDGARSAQQTFDKGYIVLGGTRSFYPEDSLLVYLVKTVPEVGVEEQVSYQNLLFGFQSYPNPFAERISIQYTLRQRSAVHIVVHNHLGQELETLIDAEQRAGLHTVVWDSRDNAGRRVPSGTYFLRLDTGDYCATRKVCVVR